MIKIIGVKFRKPGKVYYFDPTGFTVQKGDHVIVETARGVEYGTVVLGPKEVTDDQVVQPLKPLMRVATEEDAAVCASNEEKEKEAFQICLEKIKKHGLEMKLIVRNIPLIAINYCFILRRMVVLIFANW